MYGIQFKYNKIYRINLFSYQIESGGKWNQEEGGTSSSLIINDRFVPCFCMCVCMCVCNSYLTSTQYAILFLFAPFLKYLFSIEPCQNQILEIYFFKLDITGNIRHFFPKRINGISMFEKSSRKWPFSSWWAVTWPTSSNPNIKVIYTTKAFFEEKFIFVQKNLSANLNFFDGWIRRVDFSNPWYF